MLPTQLQQVNTAGRRLCGMRTVCPIDQEWDEPGTKTHIGIGQPPGERPVAVELAPPSPHLAEWEPRASGRGGLSVQLGALGSPGNKAGVGERVQPEPSSAARRWLAGIGGNELQIHVGPQVSRALWVPWPACRPPGTGRTPVQAWKRSISSSTCCPPQTRWSTGGSVTPAGFNNGAASIGARRAPGVVGSTRSSAMAPSFARLSIDSKLHSALDRRQVSGRAYDVATWHSAASREWRPRDRSAGAGQVPTMRA